MDDRVVWRGKCPYCGFGSNKTSDFITVLYKPTYNEDDDEVWSNSCLWCTNCHGAFHLDDMYVEKNEDIEKILKVN